MPAGTSGVETASPRETRPTWVDMRGHRLGLNRVQGGKVVGRQGGNKSASATRIAADTERCNCRNMTIVKQTITAFYSWQSDSPKETNLNAIRLAIDDAIKRIVASQQNLEIVRDEATRKTSGSPNILQKIFEKIIAADIFVADLTTITNSGTPKACSNPNVLFELGFAAAELGMDRDRRDQSSSDAPQPGALPHSGPV